MNVIGAPLPERPLPGWRAPTTIGPTATASAWWRTRSITVHPTERTNWAVSAEGGLLGGNGNVGEETRYADAGWTSQLGSNMVNQLRLRVV